MLWAQIPVKECHRKVRLVNLLVWLWLVSFSHVMVPVLWLLLQRRLFSFYLAGSVAACALVPAAFVALRGYLQRPMGFGLCPDGYLSPSTRELLWKFSVGFNWIFKAAWAMALLQAGVILVMVLVASLRQQEMLFPGLNVMAFYPWTVALSLLACRLIRDSICRGWTCCELDSMDIDCPPNWPILHVYQGPYSPLYSQTEPEVE
jgi:hypothetical protein